MHNSMFVSSALSGKKKKKKVPLMVPWTVDVSSFLKDFYLDFFLIVLVNFIESRCIKTPIRDGGSNEW